MLRRLADEFRESPATMALCSLWIIVFGLMVLNLMSQGWVPSPRKLALIVPGGHPFGEMTPDDLFHGEVWLPLTATFVHYGLLHLGMNLFMMYQLGGLVESWYGSWQFLAVYVVIGYGGNLLSALMRHALWSVGTLERLAAGTGLLSATARHILGSGPRVASGGGSTVILGLAALCAVVGWRSRTRIGDYVRSQMVWLLIATAILGQIVPIIDNWGHAGGALIGAAIGYAHRILIRTPRRPVARWVGGLGVLLLIASGAAQLRDDRIEAAAIGVERTRLEATARTVPTLQEIAGFYNLAWRRSRFERLSRVDESYRLAPAETVPRSTLSLLDSTDAAFRSELGQRLGQLDALRERFGAGPAAEDYRRVRSLLARVFERPPTDRIVQEFFARMRILIGRARQDEDLARARFESLRRLVPLG
jgi:rhomboid protease GluP